MSPRNIWITGAGRCGTHLLGMLADGHPDVNSFPLELNIVVEWGKLAASVSADGLRLPFALVDRHVGSLYPSGTTLEGSPGDMNPRAQGGGPAVRVTLHEYLRSFSRMRFGNERHFLFHSPGCQLATFLGDVRGAGEARVVLLLRNPVQNYLAWVEHYLQKGGGYRTRGRFGRDTGLESVLQTALFRVLTAFEAARQWKDDARVLVSRLESFTASKEERERVWDFVGIEPSPVLEATSRGGEQAEAHSGKWRDAAIRPVTDDLYDPLLSEAEARVFERCGNLFELFYEGPLRNVRVFEGDAGVLLGQRERLCLGNNLEALAKRRERLSLLFRTPPGGVPGTIKWPARIFYTMIADGIAYPHAHMLRNRKARSRALHGLAEIPELAGIWTERK